MKRKAKIWFAWLVLSLACHISFAAEEASLASTAKSAAKTPLAAPSEIKTVDGRIFRQVELQRVEPDGIAISYQADGGGLGMTKLKFQVLPENLQKRYGYNQQKASAFAADQTRQKAELQTRMVAEADEAAKRKAQRLAEEERQAAEASKQAARRGASSVNAQLLSESTESLQAKANGGDVNARRELARRDYEAWNARRTEDSRSQAINSLKPLAEGGDSNSQLRLGYVLKTASPWYEVQEGVKWMRSAADQGNVSAMLGLGSIYKISARGIPKDNQESIKWYRMAAERGIVDPALGSLYEDGGDAIEALKWYALAKRYDSGANGLYDALRSKMSADQIQEAEKRASEFKTVAATK